MQSTGLPSLRRGGAGRGGGRHSVAFQKRVQQLPFMAFDVKLDPRQAVFVSSRATAYHVSHATYNAPEYAAYSKECLRPTRSCLVMAHLQQIDSVMAECCHGVLQ